MPLPSVSTPEEFVEFELVNLAHVAGSGGPPLLRAPRLRAEGIMESLLFTVTMP